ncbi:MAG: HAD family phosphatase [Lachnospiraceae bacterium]|nr:HAD family phosphatase [Lachnospiraceae bacterium]
MIKNIIFDIGNVLAGFVWKDFFASFGFSEEINGKLAACTVLGPLWSEMDHGIMNEQEIIAAFKLYDPSIADEIDIVYNNLNGMIARYDYTIPWINELKGQGYKVYIISNIFGKMMRDCKEELDFVSLVDGAVLSYQEKIIKPDSKIYRLLLNRYGLNPTECVFIDDMERNVWAARNVGIPGIVFESYQQCYFDLKRMLCSDFAGRDVVIEAVKRLA